LVEEQIAQMKRLFGDKKIHELVFDETPYKTYRAKVASTATLKYISFNEGAGKERIYKGEGSI
jgi:phage-related protein